MDDIRSALFLEKNELMYLINSSKGGGYNANAGLIADYTGIFEPDNQKALAGLMKKNIISLAGNKLVTVKLFDFYLKKLLSADSAEIIGDENKKLVLNSPGFIILIGEHKLSQNYILIRAFQTKQDLINALAEVGDDQ